MTFCSTRSKPKDKGAKDAAECVCAILFLMANDHGHRRGPRDQPLLCVGPWNTWVSNHGSCRPVDDVVKIKQIFDCKCRVPFHQTNVLE